MVIMIRSVLMLRNTRLDKLINMFIEKHPIL
jgi:hypothetical protein